jgi:hypothetical protein
VFFLNKVVKLSISYGVIVFIEEKKLIIL